MQGTRILLLEDDRETRWALATVLRREGCRVTEGSNGEEGLRFLARGAYDLCISDVCMPGLGGFGFFSALRFGEDPQLADRRATPVLLLSGKVPTRELAQALDAGVDDFMEKPVDPEEFKARVRAALRRSRATSAPTARTSGDLADFSMAALAQTFHAAGRNSRIRVQQGAVTAVLDFQRGAIKNAKLEGPGLDTRGDVAAIEALGMERGTFEILPIGESVPHTVFLDTPSLILRAATRTDEIAMAPKVEPVAAPAESAAQTAPAAAAGVADVSAPTPSEATTPAVVAAVAAEPVAAESAE